ncbi:MAG: nucleotidyltransferase domain-containing protein [Thermoanaerobaculia bacterium]
MDRKRLVRYLEDFFSERPEGLIAAYLFGSWGRGTAGSGSDVDLGLLFEEAPPAELDSEPFRLESELEVALAIPVQAVVLNTAPPDLLHRVLRDGAIILDRDRAARIRFEVQARKEYFDLRPILEQYRQPESASR